MIDCFIIGIEQEEQEDSFSLVLSESEEDNPEVALPGGPRAQAPPSPVGAVQGVVQGGVQAAQQVAAPDAWDDEDEA